LIAIPKLTGKSDVESIGIIRFDAAQCVCAEFCRDLRSVIDVVECSTNFGSSWNPPGAVLVLVLIAMGLIAGFVILVYFLREKGRKERARLALLDEDRGEDFDPDMIIARHLAYRASAAMPPGCIVQRRKGPAMHLQVLAASNCDLTKKTRNMFKHRRMQRRCKGAADRAILLPDDPCRQELQARNADAQRL
jgi:hypothetical protein